MSHPSTNRSTTVLVVDSNPGSCDVTANICRSLGFTVRREADPTKTFQRLRDERVDFLVCELLMQPIDGLHLTRLVRQAPDSPNPEVPIIMLSGAPGTPRLAEARDAGVNEFVAKPVSQKSLHAWLKQTLENPRPFLRCDSYVGPDRRRRATAINRPERRKNRQTNGSETWAVDD